MCSRARIVHCVPVCLLPRSVDEFHELRGLGSDSLMYIKEDLIIPHHYSFYDLIVTKARGKSGPLFHFDVHDDVRMTIDANLEKVSAPHLTPHAADTQHGYAQAHSCHCPHVFLFFFFFFKSDAMILSPFDRLCEHT